MPEKKGFEIFVYKRPMEGSSLDITRCDGVMRGITLKSVKKFCRDYEKYSARVDKKNLMKSFTYIKNNDPEDHFLFHTRSKISAMATDRESVVEMDLKDLDDGSLFQLCQSVEHDDFPHVDDAVRMMYYKSMVWTQDGPDVRFTQFENMDLRGYFPASLMNMIISQYTVDSIQGFYEVL